MDLDKLKERSKIAVYDLGGGTFDLSILELNAGVFQVLSTNGNTRLGGDDLDRADRGISWSEKIQAAQGRAQSRAGFQTAQRARQRKQSSPASGAEERAGRPPEDAGIREAAEEAKIKLSTETEAEISLPFLTPEFSASSYRLTREELEKLTQEHH